MVDQLLDGGGREHDRAVVAVAAPFYHLEVVALRRQDIGEQVHRSRAEAVELKEAGVTAYNHNLDTSPEHYPNIVTSHTYADRLQTIRNVQDAGISVCCGGILGLSETITDRLLDVGHLARHDVIEIGGSTFYVGQPVVTRANDRTLTYGPDASEWVRNGDRWIVEAGTRDELYLTNRDNGHRHAIPASYIAGGNVTVDYASTISRAQGATVDEAHVIVDERTNSQQLYVAMTRGRNANHAHTAPPAFDLEQHGPTGKAEEWTATGAVERALQRHPDHMSALARRRQLRDGTGGYSEQVHDRPDSSLVSLESSVVDEASDLAAAAMRRLRSLHRGPSQGLGR